MKYVNEEKTVADVAGLLGIKNKELAGQMMGCRSLKEGF